MPKIRIVTDSTADIPISVREALNIEVVPLKIHFGDETFLDAVTIQSNEFYQKLTHTQVLPTTSQPSPLDFVELYKQLLKEEDTEIISIHLSSALSGTYQSASLAKSLAGQERKITLVDSRSASYGLGMLVVAAAEAAKEGKSAEEIIKLIGQLRDSAKIYFIVDTLEYLYRGGRIGKASALIGSLLNIKPILTIDDSGEVAPVDKVRGQKRAMRRIVELLQQDFAGSPIEVMAAHSNSLAAAEELCELVKESFTVKSLSFTNLGPVIGTHVGPGTVAVIANPYGK